MVAWVNQWKQPMCLTEWCTDDGSDWGDQVTLMGDGMLDDERPQDPPAGTSPEFCLTCFLHWKLCSSFSYAPLSIRPVCFSDLPAEPMDKGKIFPSVKFFLAAVCECHVGVIDTPAGQHPIVSLCERGSLAIPSTRTVVPALETTEHSGYIFTKYFWNHEIRWSSRFSFITSLYIVCILYIRPDRLVTSCGLRSPECTEVIVGHLNFPLQLKPAFVLLRTQCGCYSWLR